MPNKLLPKVSILLCVYNGEIEYLRESIRSVFFEQTYNNIELIIINDGSTDGKINSYLATLSEDNSNIRYFINEFNIGLTKSLNKGLMHCNGAYILRMDADDVSHKARVEKQVHFMEKHKEVDILGSEISFIYEDGSKLPRHLNYCDNEELFKIKMLFNNVGPMHPTVMIRKSFLDKTGIRYREDIKKAQDYALWIDCLNNGGVIKCLPEDLLGYRIHKNQITIDEADDQWKYKRIVIRENLKNIFGISAEDADILSSLYTEKYEYNVVDYIACIKNIAKVNREKKIYNVILFEQELRVRWIHKVLKCASKGNDISGIKNIYTIRNMFSGEMLTWIKNYCFHIPY